jgi:hypothetical protein
VNKEASHYVRLFDSNKIRNLLFWLPLVQTGGPQVGVCMLFLAEGNSEWCWEASKYSAPTEIMGTLESKVFFLFVMVSRIVSPGEEGSCCGKHERRPSHGLPSFRHFCQEWKYERSLADTGRSGDTATWCCDAPSFVAVILHFTGWISAKDAARTEQWTCRSHGYFFLVQNPVDRSLFIV